jgi:CubicO group peptidase (beta-lactamase class C family)
MVRGRSLLRARNPVLVALLLWGCATARQGPAALADGGSQDTVANLDRYFSALARNRLFSGGVLIAEQGEVLYERSFGYADRETKRANGASTSFPTASIAKTLTSTAVLQLMEKGQLALDDPAVTYLPGFPYPTITIRHLLSHTSGLPGYGALLEAQSTANPDRVFTNADFVAAIRDTSVPLSFQPGKSFAYCNTNYLVLALIVERVAGVSYQDYVRSHVLEPAGMHDTSMVLAFADYRTLQEQTDFAGAYWYPHFWYSDELLEPDRIPFYAQYWSTYGFKGFSDYRTKLRDLLRFDQALYDGTLLGDSTLQTAFTPARLNDGTPSPSGYGLGWEIDESEALGKLVHHSGGMIGFSCDFLRNLTKRQTIVLYSNTLPDNYTFVIDRVALRILNGESVEPPRKSIAREFGKALVAEGLDSAMKTLERLKSDPDYVLDEDEFNSLGYDLMGDSNDLHLPEQHRYPDAVQVLALNVKQFPASSNAHDSLAEALQKNGQIVEAMREYEAALRIDPQNEHAERTLQQLQKTSVQE